MYRPQLEVKLKYSCLEEELENLAKKLDKFEKKPLVHFRVEGKNIDRQSVYQTLSKGLAGSVLSFRQEFVDETQERLPEIKSGAFQVNQVIQEYWRKPKVAGLASELWRSSDWRCRRSQESR